MTGPINGVHVASPTVNFGGKKTSVVLGIGTAGLPYIQGKLPPGVKVNLNIIFQLHA